jgi:hypothetical protein
MRILCSITAHYEVGGGPAFLLVIETPTVMAVIAIAITPIYALSSRSARPHTREAAAVVSHAAWDYRISGEATTPPGTLDDKL